jgi:hypothetical protein
MAEIIAACGDDRNSADVGGEAAASDSASGDAGDGIGSSVLKRKHSLQRQQIVMEYAS